MKNIPGQSERIRSLNAFIKKVAPARTTILIEGESGTGKELVAKSIHMNSKRRHGPFVPVNCAVFSDSMIESELFGHERGAFTGAVQTRPGCFERARGGTIFLDEIGELSCRGQVKLLRVLQERQFERVGGVRPIDVDVRVVAATHRDLAEGVGAGWFRADLYYRLDVIRIQTPPLRERREDIPILANFFLQKYASENEKRVTSISCDTLDVLKDRAYPGNVRELQNLIEKAVVLCDDGLIRSRDVKNVLGCTGTGYSPSVKAATRAEGDALLSALRNITLPAGKNGVKPWHRCLKKVTIQAIHDCLMATGGREFSRKAFTNDLNDHMTSGRISYKTIGEYLKILKSHGICTHNSARANRARYRLSERFVAGTDDCHFYAAPPPSPCTGVRSLLSGWQI